MSTEMTVRLEAVDGEHEGIKRNGNNVAVFFPDIPAPHGHTMAMVFPEGEKFLKFLEEGKTGGEE